MNQAIFRQQSILNSVEIVKLTDGRPWSIRQLVNRGHLNGIDTYVDINVLNGRSFEELYEQTDKFK